MSGATRAAREHRLGPLAQVPLGEGREFTVGGRRVAVFRPRAGAPAATAAECPHRGGPLADGIVGMGAVVCPLHGYRFALGSGECEGGEGSLEVYPVRVDGDGDLLVTVDWAGGDDDRRRFGRPAKEGALPAA